MGSPSEGDESATKRAAGMSGDTKTDPPGDTKTDPLLNISPGRAMDKVNANLVNLHDMQADPPDVTGVHLRPTRRTPRMLAPEVVDRIFESQAKVWGETDCSRVGDLPQLGPPLSRGSPAGFHPRPAARRLDDATLREVHQLFGTVAEGNTVVIQQELAHRGIHAELRTLQRAVASLRQERRAEAWPRSGSRLRREPNCKSTSAKRSCGSPANP